MEQLAVNVRPKFVECIAPEAAQESKPRADRRIASCIVARGAPGIRKEIAAGNGDKAGISDHFLAVAVLRHEGHLGGVFQAVSERRFRVPDVTRILTPDGAQPRFHRVTHRVAGSAHPQAIAKSLPVGSVRLWSVK